MDLIIEFYPATDLWMAGLLDTHGGNEDLQEVERRENDRRVALFAAAYREALRQIAAERGWAIHIGDASEATTTPDADGDTLERWIWQEAHDRTPAEALWTETVSA